MRRAEHLPVSVGMVVEAYEQAGAGMCHHDGVAVASPVRFDEGSDQAQNLGVPVLTRADVPDRETEMVESGHHRNCAARRECFGSGGHDAPLLIGSDVFKIHCLTMRH